MKPKKAAKRTSPKSRNVVVEIPLPDGWMSMHVGRLVRRTKETIVLTDATWVASTGRRHLFFAGTPDENCEVEPFPDGVEIELPAAGAVVTAWPHPHLRVAR